MFLLIEGQAEGAQRALLEAKKAGQDLGSFAKEIRTARKLSHNNLIRVYEDVV